MCGLHHQESYPDDVEVAWRLARPHWGRGYATEAAAAWLDLGFDRLGLDRVISITEPANERSIGVMRRLGMSFDHAGTVMDEGSAFEAVVYSITAAQWSQQR
jgi:RimJ/RimL family protein N-acetyltransferase